MESASALLSEPAVNIRRAIPSAKKTCFGCLRKLGFTAKVKFRTRALACQLERCRAVQQQGVESLVLGGSRFSVLARTSVGLRHQAQAK